MSAAGDALRKAADDWQWKDWASAPRRSDPVQERLANAQYVTNWLRTKAMEADREAGEMPVLPPPEERF